MRKGILVSAGAVTIIALVSKSIGFIKQILIARYFGASLETDIYFLALGLLANLLFAVDTALITVILPAYRGKMETNDRNEVSKFVSRTLAFFIPMALVIMFIFIIIAPVISKIVASTYNQVTLIVLTKYIRLISPSLLFALIATIFTAVLNANREYVLPRIASTMISIVPIAFIIFLHKTLGVIALVLAVPTAYFLQAILMYIFVKRKTIFIWQLQKPNKEIKKVCFLMLPVLIGNATQQINQLVDKIISSSLGDGAISALAYSGTLQDFVAVAFTASIIVVLFTELSSTASVKNFQQHKAFLMRGISMLSLILAPVSLITALLSKDIVSMLYQRGAFDENAVSFTATVLSFYAIGFLFSGIRELIAKSFYAFGDTKTPTINGIGAVIVNVVLSIVFSKFLGVGGVALATSIATIQSMMILILLLDKKLQGIGIKSFIPTACKILLAIMLMGVSVIILEKFMTDIPSLLRFIFISIIGFGVYLITLTFLRCKEMFELFHYIGKVVLKRR